MSRVIKLLIGLPFKHVRVAWEFKNNANFWQTHKMISSVLLRKATNLCYKRSISLSKTLLQSATVNNIHCQYAKQCPELPRLVLEFQLAILRLSESITKNCIHPAQYEPAVWCRDGNLMPKTLPSDPNSFGGSVLKQSDTLLSLCLTAALEMLILIESECLLSMRRIDVQSRCGEEVFGL